MSLFPLQFHPSFRTFTVISSHDSTLKHSRIPRRCGENDTSTLKSNKTSRTSPSDARNIRQSTSFGNLTDEQSMELIYRTADRNNGKLIKRTKSFWKFGKSDDEILEGMAMWRHRDLVQSDTEKSEERQREREATLKRARKKSLENVNSISTNSSETLKNGQNGSRHDLTLILDDSGVKYPMTKSDIDQRIQHQQQHGHKHEEQIYGQVEMPAARPKQNVVSRSKLLRQSYLEMEQEEVNNNKPKRGQQSHPQPQVRTSKSGYAKVSSGAGKIANGKISADQDIIEFYDTRHLNTLQKHKQTYDDAEDSSLSAAAFFDDESVNGEMVMKTVNRQEILKQYYSSGTDTERHSASSSDPYDCIVVEDHLVRKENEKNKANNPKMDFSTFRGDDPNGSETDQSRSATLLPRTKLTKTSSKESSHQRNGKAADDFAPSNGEKRDRRSDRNRSNGDRAENERSGKSKSKSRRENEESQRHMDANSIKSYGQWYDLWGQDASVNMQMS